MDLAEVPISSFRGKGSIHPEFTRVSTPSLERSEFNKLAHNGHQMGLHTNCVQVKHICAVLWTLTCELWMVQEPDELLCHGCSSFNSPNECQYPFFTFVKELNKHVNLFTSAVKLNLWTEGGLISCIFKPQSLQLDWIYLFMGPLACVVLTWGPQFYPFTAQWDEYRLRRPWLEMLHFKLQYILIAECWKLMRNCFSGIILPPISSYSLVRK